jgi:hypothetical protein
MLEIEKAKKSSFYTLVLYEDGKKVYIHSKYDPIKEAFSKVSGVPRSDVYIVFGLGLGYHILELRKRFSDSEILVFEPSLHIYKMYKKYGVKLDNVKIFINKEEFLSYFSTKRIVDFFILKLSSLYNIYRNIYEEVEEGIRSIVDREKINRNTIQRFGKVFLRNFIYNLHYIKRYRSLLELKDRYKGKMCIIVAGGPSLEGYVSFLKRVSEKVIIFSVDTAYSFLVKNNIFPDFVVSIDPQFINAIYILEQSLDVSSSYLISDLLASYLVNRYFAERILLINPPILEKLGVFKDVFPSIGYGGSVFTAALSSALYMGFSKILFLGLDLAYRGYKTHIRGTPTYNILLHSANRFSLIESEIYKRIKHISGFIFFDGKDRLISNQKFLLFRDWVEKTIRDFKDRGVIFYRIGGGIPIKGLRDIDVEDFFVIFRGLSEKKVYKNSGFENKELIFFLKRMRDSTKFLKEEIYKALIYIACNRRGRGYKEKILKKMFLIEQKILDFKDIVNIAGLGVQREAVLIRGSDGRGSVSLYRLYSFYNRLYKAFMYMEEKIRKVVESI